MTIGIIGAGGIGIFRIDFRPRATLTFRSRRNQKPSNDHMQRTYPQA
jgi:hypothetical protein